MAGFTGSLIRAGLSLSASQALLSGWVCSVHSAGGMVAAFPVAPEGIPAATIGGPFFSTVLICPTDLLGFWILPVSYTRLFGFLLSGVCTVLHQLLGTLFAVLSRRNFDMQQCFVCCMSSCCRLRLFFPPQRGFSFGPVLGRICIGWDGAVFKACFARCCNKA